MAYAIEGALMDCDWRALPFDFRRQLALDFSQLPRLTTRIHPTRTRATRATRSLRSVRSVPSA